MDDTLFFAEEVETKTALTNPWKVLIVDDEEDVHTITELVLRDFVFESRGLELIHAHNAVEAYEIIKSEKDIALALVDVMMETDHAGLDLVVDIREKLKNKILRIILRTGQPGQAPEERIIVDYDINDYKAKTELTATKLKTTIYASLRSYRDLMIIERNRCGLERVIRSLGNINQKLNITDISSAILFETAQVLGLNEDAAYVSVLSKHQDHSPNEYHILASIGDFDNKNGAIPSDMLPLFEQALQARSSIYEGVHYVGYIREENGNENLLYVSKQSPFSDLDISLLEIFANNVAIAFGNMVLREELEAGRQELVYILGEAVESRSKETGSHVKRVGEISALLARKYGLGEYECRIIQLASPLHDSGKIAIPDHVLNKPGKLDDDERAIMNTHSQIGHDLLNKSTSVVLQNAAVIAQEHHENWDGSGYPHGKKGDDIHIYARIAGMVDVFDALGSKRCYKEEWSREDILAFIENESGKKFDPKLVELLLENIDEICAIRSEFPDAKE